MDKKTVEHIGKLARLTVSETEAEKFASQFTQVFEAFEKIAKVDTEGVEPMVTPTPIVTKWREDEIVHEYSAEELTRNAPSKSGQLFKVPPVV